MVSRNGGSPAPRSSVIDMRVSVCCEVGRDDIQRSVGEDGGVFHVVGSENILLGVVGSVGLVRVRMDAESMVSRR